LGRSALAGGRGLLLAALVGAGLLAWRAQGQRVELTRFRLPSFDAHVYVAMAEEPLVFSVPPWGYRLLTPLVVHALPGRAIVVHFRRIAWVALLAALVLLFLWLRRLGFGPGAALAGVACFGLSPPIASAVAQPLLAEPLTLALALAFLLALEAGAPLGALAALAALGALSKELALLGLPVLVLRRLRLGGPPAALRSLLAAAPALGVLAVLRFGWAPHLSAAGPALAPAALAEALVAIGGAWREWLPLVGWAGLMPLAAVGALRRSARAYLADYGLALAVLLALPFGAGSWTGEHGFAGFFVDDVARLYLYPLPLLLPLTLVAVDRVLPLRSEPVAPSEWPGWSGPLGGVLAAALVCGLALGLDRYRRIDLGPMKDGPRVLAVVREGRRTAERLSEGAEVRFEAERQRFAWGVDEPERLGRMRWFLLEGWGPHAHYGIDDIRMREDRASLLLPLREQRPIAVDLRLAAEAEARLRVFVNGQPAGEAQAAPEAPSSRVALPASALMRGDNVITLVGPGPQARARLLSLAYRPL
jgi:hypothetical protein